MEELLQILHTVLEVAGRFRSLEVEIPYSTLVLPALLLVFGVMNCLLGYRLMRFWMMLIGFAIGVAAAYFAIRNFGLSFESRSVYFGILIGAGAAVALVSFVFYKAGIFLMAAVLGASAAIYLIYPTTSASFYLCLLIGVLMGILAVRYDRPVIIITTSLFGGILAGYSLARILGSDELRSLLFCAGFVLGGCFIQFWLNDVPDRNENEASVVKPDFSDCPSSSARSRRERKNAERRMAKNHEDQSAGNWKGVYKGWEESDEEKKQAQEDFYDQYFHGGDVFDRTTREIRELTGDTDHPDVHIMAWNEKKKKNRGKIDITE